MSPRKPPIQSYGNELLAALTEGGRRKIELELPYRDAIALRARLYKLRHLMLTEHHPLADIVARARIQVRWGPSIGDAPVPETHNSKNVPRPSNPNTHSRLIISPHDSEFAEPLRKAGVQVRDDLQTDPLTQDPEARSRFDSILDDFVPDAEKKP